MPQEHLAFKTDPYLFEEMCRDVLNVYYNRKFHDKFELYAGRGEGDFGIDIRGIDLEMSSNDNPVYIVAQCKNYQVKNAKSLVKVLERDVKRISEKAPFTVKRIIIMTSVKRTQSLQNLATDLHNKYKLSVEIFFWEDIEGVILGRRELLKKFYPNYVLQIKDIFRDISSDVRLFIKKYKTYLLILMIGLSVLIGSFMFQKSEDNLPKIHETFYTYPDDGNSSSH